jgi:hypothetical protein
VGVGECEGEEGRGFMNVGEGTSAKGEGVVEEIVRVEGGIGNIMVVGTLLEIIWFSLFH